MTFECPFCGASYSLLNPHFNVSTETEVNCTINHYHYNIDVECSKCHNQFGVSYSARQQFTYKKGDKFYTFGWIYLTLIFAVAVITIICAHIFE